MRIGELSRRTGVSVRMLRYYEAEALLRPQRRASGYRDFSETDVTIVAAIRKLSAAGLKLDFIRQFLPCLRSAAPILHPCPALMAAMEERLQALDGQIAAFQESRALLSQYHAQMREHV